MSGGSFNYVCFADEWNVWEKTHDLEAMEAFLTRLKGAEEPAAELVELLAIIRQSRTRVAVHLKRLRPVMQAAEWWQSGDYGEAQFREAVAEYRGDAKPDTAERGG